LENMVGHEETRTPDLYRVKQPAIDSKGVNNRRNRQNRNTRRNLLPNCYQNIVRSFHFHPCAIFAGSNFRSTLLITAGWCSPALPTNV
jgi:hypothetical protein